MYGTRNKKQKLTSKELLSATALPEVGGYTRSELPVGQLPEVLKAARAEYKREQSSLPRRLGRAAVDGVAIAALITSNPQIYLRSTERNEKSLKTGEGINFIGRIAVGRLMKSFKRFAEGPHRRQAAHERAVAKYREQHPEIAKHEAKLRSEREKQQDEQIKRSIPYDLMERGKYAIDYFAAKNLSSFSKTIPRRPHYKGQPGFTGNYAKLAEQSITSAIAHKTEDGTIPLLGLELEHERLEEHYAQGQSLAMADKSETEYLGGVSSALWQLGFVQFKDESNVAYGNGNFNPAIEWEKTSESVIARIPFDATNELHQILAPDQSIGASSMVELEMSARDSRVYDRSRAPYLNMRVVDANASAAA